MLRYPDISKVLPLVYDNTLSYYEVLGKVKDKLNELIDLGNAQSVAINELSGEMEEDYNKFQQEILQDLEDMKTELLADIAEGDTETYNAVNELITALSERVTTNENDISDLESTTDALVLSVGEIESDVTTLESAVQTNTSNIAGLDARLVTTEGDVSDIKTTLTGIGTEISGLGDDVDALETRVGDIEDDLEHLVFADVDTDLNASSTNPVENRAVTGAINTINGNVSTLSGDVTTLSGNVNTLSGNVTTLSGDVSTLSGTVTSQGNAITALGGRIDALTLDDLSDVDMTGVTNGQVPAWDSAQSKYVPVTPSGGGADVPLSVVDGKLCITYETT